MAYMVGMLTAAFSFLVNRLLVKTMGATVIISWGPVVEEGSKTLLSYFLGADILAAHLSFGVLEAIYDCFYGSPRHKGWAVVGSIAGHGMFGGITVWLLSLSGSIWWGLLGGSILHLVWNRTVVFYGSKSNQE